MLNIKINMNSYLKILYTTDLHFNKTWFKWIQNQQDNFDIFVISGDFLESSRDEALKEQIIWISNWIKQFKKILFVCSGNHDIDDLDNEDWLNKIVTSNYYADNSKKTINGIKFGCVPYIGAEYYEFDDCDILITHIPPANTKTSIDKNNNDWGDKDLYRLLKNKIINPKIIFCGHMHNPLQTSYIINDTTIYNVGVSNSSSIPNHKTIVI